MGLLKTLFRATSLWIEENAADLVSTVLLPVTGQLVVKAAGQPVSRWLTRNLWSIRTVDGAVLGGIAPVSAGAKYALPKGLPEAGKRTLAIENEPHTLEGFDGIIESGYGKGRKSLLFAGRVPVKVGGQTSLRRVEYHQHDADVAGLHYDLAIEDLPPGTKQFELHIPNSEFKGRYAFVTTAKGMICVPMTDQSVLLPKPAYSLKPEDFLAGIDPAEFAIERKVDGSLGNMAISKYRAVFRSHRETGEAYYDKLPQLEILANRSRIFTFRKLMPGPDLEGTVLQGELLHPDGASRVSGILNALPEKAQATQKVRGPVQFYGWDIVSYRGKDVSGLPYWRRRDLLDTVVDEIRVYNRHWHVVDRCPEGTSPLDYYRQVINDPRGLPWAEGIVVKRLDAPRETSWIKVKNRDLEDFIVTAIYSSAPGTKYADSVAVMVVQDPTSGNIGEVGSFAIPDVQRKWIYDNRDKLIGAVAKVMVMEKTKAGVPRAGVFHSWHGDPRFGGQGTEMSLAMYAEALAGGESEESKRMLYRLKSSAGWSQR